MNERLAKIHARRALLQARAAEERDEIARLVRVVTAPVRFADWGLRAFRLLRSGPVLMGGALAAAALLRRGHPIRWAVRALALWQAWRRFRGGDGRKA